AVATRARALDGPRLDAPSPPPQEELGRVGDHLRAPEIEVRPVRHRMLAAELRRQRPRGRDQQRREGLREVHLVDVARGEECEDAPDRLPVARRREQRREGSAERPIPRRSRGGESLEPWRPGARVGAEERVLLAAAVVGEQRVVPTQEGERQVAAADDAVARRLDEAPELVAETADDPAAERKGQGRSEEHTSELQSLAYLVCRLLLE